MAPVAELGSVLGQYRILQQIGAGGMGAVYIAEHITLGRRAALKVLLPELSHRPEIVTRFFNEARAATAINDPGIVQIFDFGHADDGRAYLVMELLDGEPLDKRLERDGALPVPTALRIMRQVASTLGAAHQRGIIHRDLKPENIFMARDPEVAGGERAKVLDFGIAKLTGDNGGMKTQTSAVMGTPAYMSPEQCRGAGHVDQRSDVYSLGCVLCTLVTGRPPFDADGAGLLIVKHLTEQPPAPSQLHPGIPPAIDQLVLRCLAKDPAQRFNSGTELAMAIGTLVGSAPQLPQMAYSNPGYAPPGVTPTTLSAATGTGSIPPLRPQSHTGLIVGVIALLAVAGGIVAIVTTRGADKDKDAVAAAPPTPAPTTPAVQPPAPQPPPAPAPDKPEPIDPHKAAEASIKNALQSFVTWAKAHPGAPCPDAAALGGAPDPWGHPLKITCTEQPREQIMGVTSLGPDGTLNTDDDTSSWQLTPEVLEIVKGSPWAAPIAKVEPARPDRPRSTSQKSKAQPHPQPPQQQPSGGVILDENGLPISR